MPVHGCRFRYWHFISSFPLAVCLTVSCISIALSITGLVRNPPSLDANPEEAFKTWRTEISAKLFTWSLIQKDLTNNMKQQPSHLLKPTRKPTVLTKKPENSKKRFKRASADENNVTDYDSEYFDYDNMGWGGHWDDKIDKVLHETGTNNRLGICIYEKLLSVFTFVLEQSPSERELPVRIAVYETNTDQLYPTLKPNSTKEMEHVQFCQKMETYKKFNRYDKSVSICDLISCPDSAPIVDLFNPNVSLCLPEWNIDELLEMARHSNPFPSMNSKMNETRKNTNVIMCLVQKMFLSSRVQRDAFPNPNVHPEDDLFYTSVFFNHSNIHKDPHSNLKFYDSIKDHAKESDLELVGLFAGEEGTMDIFERSMWSDMKICIPVTLALVFGLMFGYTGSIFYSSVVLMSAGFSFTISYFLYFLIFDDFWFTNYLGAVILLGIGADDCFVLVHNLQQEELVRKKSIQRGCGAGAGADSVKLTEFSSPPKSSQNYHQQQSQSLLIIQQQQSSEAIPVEGAQNDRATPKITLNNGDDDSCDQKLLEQTSNHDAALDRANNLTTPVSIDTNNHHPQTSTRNKNQPITQVMMISQNPQQSTCSTKKCCTEMIPLSVWMLKALKHAAITMFITSATTAAAFLCNIVTPVLGIKAFGMFSGCLVVINYLMVITLVPASLILKQRYLDNSCGGSYSRASKFLKGLIDISDKIQDHLFRRTIPKWVDQGKWVLSCLLTLLVLASCCIIFYKPGLRRAQNTTQLFHKDHEIQWFQDEFVDHFDLMNPSKYEEVHIVWGTNYKDTSNPIDNLEGYLDLWSKFKITRRFLMNQVQLCKRVKKYGYETGEEGCFAECLIRKFNGTKESAEREEAFKDCYQTQRSTMERTNQLLKATYSGPWWDANEPEKGIQKVMRSVDNSSIFSRGWPVASSRLAFRRLQSCDLQDTLQKSTAISVSIPVAIALLVVLSTTIISQLCVRPKGGPARFIRTVACGFVASFTCISIIATTVACMALMKWKLNTVESVIIALAIGLSFDFTMHYAYAYVKQDLKRDTKASLVAVFQTAGIPVLLSFISTFIAGCCFIFAGAYPLYQVGLFMVIVTASSWMSATFLFPAAMATTDFVIIAALGEPDPIYSEPSSPIKFSSIKASEVKLLDSSPTPNNGIKSDTRIMNDGIDNNNPNV